MTQPNGSGPAPAQAAEAIGPEAEVLAAVDPPALGGAGVKLAQGLLMNPGGVPGQREPPPLGSERHPPLGDAPGTYVHT